MYVAVAAIWWKLEVLAFSHINDVSDSLIIQGIPMPLPNSMQKESSSNMQSRRHTAKYGKQYVRKRYQGLDPSCKNQIFRKS